MFDSSHGPEDGSPSKGCVIAILFSCAIWGVVAASYIMMTR